MGKEQEAFLRVIFLVNSYSKNSDEIIFNGVEIYDYDYFVFDFHRDYEYEDIPMSNDIQENIGNNLEVLLEKVEEAGHKTTGFFELVGTYTQEWESSYDYWSGATEWDCHWDIIDYKLHKLNKYQTKKYLQGQYHHGNRRCLMSLIESFGLLKELNLVRDFNGDTFNNDLFTFNSEADKIDISLIN